MTAIYDSVSTPGDWDDELHHALLEDMYEDPGKHGLVRCPGRGGCLCSPNEFASLKALQRFYDYSHNCYWDLELANLSDAVWGVKGSLDIMELSETEFLSDSEGFLKSCEEKEALLALQARSPLPGGWYLVPSVFQSLNIPDYEEAARGYGDMDWEDHVSSREVVRFAGQAWLDPSSRKPFHSLTEETAGTELDAGDRVVVNAKIVRIGHKFITAVCDKGDIYVDLKYTRWIPPVGEEVAMIVRLKDVTKAMRWMCVKVVL